MTTRAILRTLPAATMLALPALALAAEACTASYCTQGFGKILITAINIINDILVPFLFAIAFFVFLYGIFQGFILGGANDEKRAQGRQVALWGVIGFAIMVSLWGLVHVVTATFDITEGGGPPSIPTL